MTTPFVIFACVEGATLTFADRVNQALVKSRMTGAEKNRGLLLPHRRNAPLRPDASGCRRISASLHRLEKPGIQPLSSRAERREIY
jgi:hypothetical protein